MRAGGADSKPKPRRCTFENGCERGLGRARSALTPIAGGVTIHPTRAIQTANVKGGRRRQARRDAGIDRSQAVGRRPVVVGLTSASKRHCCCARVNRRRCFPDCYRRPSGPSASLAVFLSRPGHHAVEVQLPLRDRRTRRTPSTRQCGSLSCWPRRMISSELDAPAPHGGTSTGWIDLVARRPDRAR